MNIFLHQSTPDEVSDAGEKIILAMYKAENYGSLNSYPGPAYKRGVAKLKLSSQFKLQSLPPTYAHICKCKRGSVMIP